MALFQRMELLARSLPRRVPLVCHVNCNAPFMHTSEAFVHTHMVADVMRAMMMTGGTAQKAGKKVEGLGKKMEGEEKSKA